MKETPGKTDPFYKKAGISFFMRFGGLALQFAGSIYVARALGASGFGAFALASTWAAFAGLMLSLGLGELSLRELPRYLTRGQHRSILGFFVTIGLTLVVTITITALVFRALQNSGLLVFSMGWQLVALLAAVQGIILTISHILNGFQRILISQFLETVLRPVFYLLLLLVAVAFGLNLTSDNVFLFSVIAAVLVLGLMIRVLSGSWGQTVEATGSPEFNLRIWFAASIPVLLTLFANRLQLDLDVIMVGAMLGDHEVGIYRAAARGALLLSIANMVALQLVGPMLSRALADNDNAQVQSLLTRAALVSFIAGFPMLLILGFGAGYYLALFGPEFTEASLALRLLLMGQATIILAGADAILLIMLHKERIVTLVTALGVLLNILLNLVLIGRYGIEGAALASLVSMALVRVTLVTVIFRTTNFRPMLFGRRSPIANP